MGKRYKPREWRRWIEAVRASGEPVKAVAKRLGVKESTAYHSTKRAGKAAPRAFAEVIPTAQMSKIGSMDRAWIGQTDPVIAIASHST